MVTVYIDVLFAVNFIINVLIVEGTAVMLGKDAKMWRKLLSAGMGALYAVMMFFPDFAFATSAVMKLGLSAVMVKIAFETNTTKGFLKLLGTFYAVSFIFGGGISAVLCMSGIGAKMGAVVSNGTIYFDVPWKILALSSACVYFFIYLFARIRRKRVAESGVRRNLEIYINGAKIETGAIIDTGNSLCDPISGAPVIVCEYGEIEKIVPNKKESLIENMVDAGLRIRLIPFSSVGKENGIMPAFCPDRVIIDDFETNKCVVGISAGKLSAGDEYHALLNPMILVSRKV